MKVICSILLWSLVLVSKLALGQAKSQEANAGNLVKKLGEEFIKNPESVGLSIGIFDKGNTYFYNFGTPEKGKSQLPTQNTIYEIGSITKTFTSTLLAYAVLEKKVKLEDDIRKYLPGDYLNLAYKGRPIQLIHLANLTSGLPNWLPDNPELFTNTPPDSIPYALLELHKDYTRQNFFKDLHTVKLDTFPGSTPKHSNVAAQLLGYILEGVYKISYQDLLKKYILNPNGMVNTAFLASKTKPEFLARGYNQNGKEMPYITMEDVQVAGGLNSTTSDMVKYIKYQLEKNNKAVEMSHQPKWGNIVDRAVGLNWQLNKTKSGIFQVWHTGGTFGFSSYIVLFPELNLGMVLLANESDATTQSKLAYISDQIFESIQQK